MVNQLTSQLPTKRQVIRPATLKSLSLTLLFIILAALTEFLVVIYAMELGVVDPTLLKTNWPVTIAMSPLFNLVPIAVIVTLVFNWIYLSRKLTAKGQELRKGKVEIPAKRGARSKKISSRIGRPFRNFFGKIRSARPTVKGALVVVLLFLLFVLTVSLLAYPQLLYRAISSAYQNNPSLVDFVLSVDSSAKGFAEAVAPIGWIGASVNNALVASAAGVGGAGESLGRLVTPVASLDDAGKYLVVQNAAAWISAFLILFYGEFMRKGYRYRKK
jgi:hypothetical protein